MAAPQLLPAGAFSTSGNQIVDKNGNPLRIAAVNWTGMHLRNGVPLGLNSASYQTLLQQIVSTGFNTVRFPLCDMLVISNDMPFSGAVNTTLNTDLVGKSCMQVLDAMITYCGTINLRVILESHNNEGVASASNIRGIQQNGLWYDKGGASDTTDGAGNTGHVADTDFQSNWVAIATRYKTYSAILGYDIRTEPKVAPTGQGSRIVAPLTATTVTAASFVAVDKTYSGITLPSGKPFHYELAKPANFDGTKLYPLLIWLHPNQAGNPWYQGQASTISVNEAANFNTVAEQRARPKFVCVPYADQTGDSAGGTQNWGGWVNDGSTASGTHFNGESGPNVFALLAMINQLKADNPSIDPNRIYVMGFSLGGHGAGYAMDKYNQITGTLGKYYTAGVAIAGALEYNGYGVGPTAADAARVKGTHLWCIAGQSDGTSIPSHWSLPLWDKIAGNSTYPQSLGTASQTLAGGDFHLSYLPNTGHQDYDNSGVFMGTNSNVLTWLFSQANGSVTSAGGTTGVTWADGSNTDLRAMYQRVGNAIQAIDTRPLIFCQGPQHPGATFATGTPADGTNYGTGTTFDGHSGDLSGVRASPVVLTTASKVVYSVHEYPPETSGDGNDIGGATKITLMNAVWGFLIKNNTAPVFVGEMGSWFNGTTAQQSESTTWGNSLVSYLNGTAATGPTFSGANQGVSWGWWDFEVSATGGAVPNYGILTAWSGGSPRANQFSAYSQMFYTGGTPTPTPTPTPTVTKDRAGILSSIKSNLGKTAMSGQYIERDAGGDGSYSTITAIKTKWGYTPAVCGLDCWFFNASFSNTANRTNVAAAGKKHWTAGGLVTLSLSMPNPITLGGCADTSGGSNMLARIITNGDTANTNFKSILDAVALPIQDWKDAGVVVMFRLFHEQCGNWFWWGTQSGSNTDFKNAWQYVWNYFTTTKSLNNIIWVMGSGFSNILDRVPYAGQVDIVGQDSYGDNIGDYDSIYTTVTNAGYPTALTEWGSGGTSQGNANYDLRLLTTHLQNTMTKSVYFLAWGLTNGTSWDLTQCKFGDQALGNSFITNIESMPTWFGSTTPTPTPTPPGGFTESINGTVITTVGSKITDQNGNTWALSSGGQVLVNGQADPTTSGVDELAYVSKLIWQHAAAGWYSKSTPTDRWSPDGGTQVSPIGNAPVASPDGTIVTTVGPAITDANGNLWTLLVQGSVTRVAINGNVDGSLANAVEIAIVSNRLWAQSSDHLWRSKVLPGDAWLPQGGSATGPFSSGGSGNPDISFGSGSDQFILKMSGDAYQNTDGTSDAAGNPRFQVSLDGTQLNGNFITTASHTVGAVQNFVFNGAYGSTKHSVQVTFDNDAFSAGPPTLDRNLYVNDLVWLGTSTGNTASFQMNGAQSFSVQGTPIPPPTPVPTPTPPTIPTLPGKTLITPDFTTGTGSDQLVLGMSGDPYANGDGTSDAAGDPKFSVTVDGVAQGSTFITTALHASSQYQQFIFNGTFGTGTHNVAVTFLNDAYNPPNDRNLYVEGVIYQSVNTNQSASLLANLQVATFPVTGATPTPPPPTPVPTPTPPIAGNVWNIHSGIRAWAASEIVELGDVRNNHGVAYQCVFPGSCAGTGGPTGTDSNILDGSARWKFLSNIEFFDRSGAVTQLPTVFTADITHVYWNEATQSTAAGTPFISLAGHTMTSSSIGGFSADFSQDFAGGSASSASYSLIMTAGPGYGLRDSLITESRPLQFDANRGAAFLQPLTASTTTSYISINDPSVIIDGLQFKDPLGTSDSIMLFADTLSTSIIVRNCIFDGTTQQGNASMFFMNTSGRVIFYNCLIIDRQLAAGTSKAIRVAQGVISARFVNCTFVAVNAPAAGGLLQSVGGFTGGVVKNCGIFGYGVISDAGWTFDHCVTDKANFGSGVDGGNNHFNAAASAQFHDPLSDWSLLPTSVMIDNAVTDLTDIPSGDDIAGLPRGQGPHWDVGCWESEGFGVREDQGPQVQIWQQPS